MSVECAVFDICDVAVLVLVASEWWAWAYCRQWVCRSHLITDWHWPWSSSVVC